MTRAERLKALHRTAHERILIIDGAMGTMIQGYNPTEATYQGTRFSTWPHDLKNNSDVLSLSQPQMIGEIHDLYLAAGADIVETNTFGAQRIAQADYGMEKLSREMNVTSAKLARAACDKWEAIDPDRARYVAGALGPTNRTASISPDVNDPGKRNVTFDELVEAYTEQVHGLVEGGADIILIETIFDTLNAKAAGFATLKAFDELGLELPIMLSGTITDKSGRTLSGQTATAFWYSMRHLKPFSIGLNCALGAKEMRPYIQELAAVADTLVSAYPNAGLPNPLSATGYDETPDDMACQIAPWAEEGFLNIVGGCCGSTPEHVAEIRRRVENLPPRELPRIEPRMRLSGLEPFVMG